MLYIYICSFWRLLNTYKKIYTDDIPEDIPEMINDIMKNKVIKNKKKNENKKPGMRIKNGNKM